MISDFNRDRHAEWLHATGYEENDAPYSWCIEAINSYPENVISRSIYRFMEAWRYGYAVGLSKNREVLLECHETIGNTGRFPELFERIDDALKANASET